MSADSLDYLKPDVLQTILDGNHDFYTYELDFANIAPGNTPQSSFTVQADSNFLWTHACCFADIAAAGQTNADRVLPLVSAVITDTSSGRQLMSNPVPIPSIFGYGSEPYAVAYPRMFRSNTQVTISLNNYDAANTYNLRLSFIGLKFFKFGTQ